MPDIKPATWYETRNWVRDLAISMLTDENGVSEETFRRLIPLLDEYNLSILHSVCDATDGRFYLPQTFDGWHALRDQDGNVR